MNLTKKQVTALKRLHQAQQENNGPAIASDVRCYEVWYAGSVLGRLAKRGLVEIQGRGAATTYSLTDAGSQAISSQS